MIEVKNVVRWMGPVRFVEYEETMNKIEKYLENKETLPITLIITSEGGIIPVAYTFVKEVTIRKVPLNTVIVGRAESAAVALALTGKIRAIEAEAHIFLHDLQFSEDENQEKKENMRNWYITFLAKRSKLTKRRVENMMKEETLLNAQQAKKYGFVDQIIN